jgi:hypothetical protein
MRSRLIAIGIVCLAVSAAYAVEANIVSYAEGELNFSLKGSGTVSVNAQVDFKYISDRTGEEALARAKSDPMKIKLTGEETPGKIEVIPPEGALIEVEVILFVDGEEKARQTYYY